jgi:hypothetical protein
VSDPRDIVVLIHSNPLHKETTMKKLLTTLALALGLLFGGMALVPATANAADCQIGTTCIPEPEPCPIGGCTTPPCPVIGGCDAVGYRLLMADLASAEQTANEYRQQVVALTAKVDRLQRIADRRAETIAELRAKIRALR